MVSFPRSMVRERGQTQPATDAATAQTAAEADIARLAASDPAAFAPLYEAYLQPVYIFCYRRLGHRQAAEDATSVIFQKALTSIDAFRGGSFRAWLFRIATNTVTDLYRTSHPASDLAAAVTLHDPAPGPEARAELSERERLLHAALSQLPEEWQHVIQLRLAGLNGPEIAMATGRSHDWVRTTQHRAMMHLRMVLAVEPDGEAARHAD